MPGLCLPPLAVRLSSGLFTTRAELVKQFGLIVERLRTNGAACGLLTHKYLPCTYIQPLISALMGGGIIWSQEVPEPPFCSLSQVRPQGNSLALAPRLLRGLFICEIACVLLVSGRSACLMLMSL